MLREQSKGWYNAYFKMQDFKYQEWGLIWKKQGWVPIGEQYIERIEGGENWYPQMEAYYGAQNANAARQRDLALAEYRY